MTKTQLLISILPILFSDIAFSIWYVRKYQPKNDNWKVPVWLLVASLIAILCDITSQHLSGTFWKSILLAAPIAPAYMAIKNMALGIIWHGDPFYLGKKGFDATIAMYFQNGKLLVLSLGIITLVFSGLYNYV